MALLFMDGFSHYSSLLFKWNTISGSPTINASAGRIYGGALVSVGSQFITRTSNEKYQELIIGFAHKPVTNLANAVLIALRNSLQGATNYINIDWDTSNTRYLYRLGTNTVGISEPIVLGEWYHLQLKIRVDNITGSYEFRLNNATEVSATNVDTQPSSTPTNYIDTILFGSQNTGTHHFDDFYLCDTSGSINNDFLGDVVVETIFPNANGTKTQFSPSTGTNFENVDDVTHDSDATYNSSSTLNNADTFDFPSLATSGGTVFGIQTNLVARKAAVGIRKMSDVIISNTNEYDGNETALGANYANISQIHEVNPDTSSAWTISGINSAEFGYKITE
jgi:hypothetical protein